MISDLCSSTLTVQVQEKQDLEGLPKKLAVREVRLDRILAMNGGSAEKGLYSAVVNAYSQGEVWFLLERKECLAGIVDARFLHFGKTFK